MQKKRIAVIFGGRSPEHEVSIITAVQAMASFPDKYEILPIYVTKTGELLTGESLKSITAYQDASLIKKTTTALTLPTSPNTTSFTQKNILGQKQYTFDLIFPCFHGGVGEGGWIQGLAEYYQVPLVGTGLTGAVLGIDKVAMKHLFAHARLSQAPFHWFYRQEWESGPSTILKYLQDLKYPLYVKPSRGGSSIGTTCVHNAKELRMAIDLAAAMDTRVIVEEGITNAREVNISVMGIAGGKLELSVCEEVFHHSAEFLNFADKYLGGSKSEGMASTDRVIPATLSKSVKAKLESTAETAFRLLDCAGLVRIDFLIKNNQVYIIEVNTIPGSLSFYIWEKSGYKYPSLLDHLIELALQKQKITEATLTDFASPILTNIASGGKLSGKLK